MPRYLIHVGPHKTGTTYLQFRFHAARQYLRERGIAYPAVWSASEHLPSHQKLMIGLRDGKLAELSAQFREIVDSDVECVLISSEGINLLEQAAIDTLKSLIGDAPGTVIFYCRRWSELLPSLWQETVKHGRDDTLPEFLAANLNDPYDSRAINFAHAIERYINAFGRNNIRLVSYSNLSDSGTDLAEHFFATFLPRQQAVLDQAPPLANARPNQSFPLIDTEVIRALNSLHMMRGGERSPELRVWYTQRSRTLGTAELTAAIEANIQTLPFSDASPALARLHDELSAAYGDLVVEPVRSRRLFEPRDAQIRFAQQRYLTDRSARDQLEKLYTAFLADTGRTPDLSPAP